MKTASDARQIEQVLSHLARLKHDAGTQDSDLLEDLRPIWLSPDAWDIVLEDLEAQRYREHVRMRQAPQLRLVGGSLPVQDAACASR